MIYCSYFNNPLVRGVVGKIDIYSIALSQFTAYPVAREFLVRRQDFSLYHSNTISLDQLKKYYRENVLEKFSDDKLQSLAEKYDNCILCCHEKVGCHREELIKFLNSKNIECKELESDDIVRLLHLDQE